MSDRQRVIGGRSEIPEGRGRKRDETIETTETDILVLYVRTHTHTHTRAHTLRGVLVVPRSQRSQARHDAGQGPVTVCRRRSQADRACPPAKP